MSKKYVWSATVKDNRYTNVYTPISEAMELWLDDGGVSDNEAAYEARGFSPFQFFGP